MRRCFTPVLAALGGFAVLASAGWAQRETTEPRFGTTVYLASGFEGRIYYLDPGTPKLPDLSKLRSVGSIYAQSLNVPWQSFTIGFPGVTARFEWFAIDYVGRFWIPKSAQYRFGLISDDGSKLAIDGKTVIDNDGIHPLLEIDGGKKLKAGTHTFRVTYFQGPGTEVALVFLIAAPNEDLHVFNSAEFQPPPDAPEKLLRPPVQQGR